MPRPTTADADKHKRNPSGGWIWTKMTTLVVKLFHVISEERVLWSGHARIAIRRALEDVRRYHFHPDRSALLPSKKKKVIVEGSSVTKEDVMMQKIEGFEDEAEEIEEPDAVVHIFLL